LIVRDDKLVSLLDEKKAKLKKMAELSWNAILDSAFEGSGLERKQQYDGKTLYVKLTDNRNIYFRLGESMTPAKAQQAADIAGRFKELADVFSHQAEKVEFGRIWVEHQRKKSQFCYAFKSDAVDIELSVEGANDTVRETFILSTRVFSMVTFQIERIEEKYGRKHLHFTIN
jgi:Neuraminidase (sialidase)